MSKNSIIIDSLRYQPENSLRHRKKSKDTHVSLITSKAPSNLTMIGAGWTGERARVPELAGEVEPTCAIQFVGDVFDEKR